MMIKMDEVLLGMIVGIGILLFVCEYMWFASDDAKTQLTEASFVAIRNLQQENERLLQTNERLRKHNERLQKRSEDLQKQNEELRKQNETLNRYVEELRG
jgi:TolA-binding protein